MNGEQTTFGAIAENILAMVLREGYNSKRIDVVFDRYQESSIKNFKRDIRGQDSGIQVQILSASMFVRQWRNFLTNMTNKTSLIRFLVSEWKTKEHSKKIIDHVLYVTCEEKCYKITNEDCHEVLELNSTQEEADGRLLLHAAHAAKEGYTSILLCSEDTIVFILGLAFQNSINASLYQKCGTKICTKVIDIRKIAEHIGTQVCKALIGLHSYTGCDTVSAFAGKGKISALKTMITSESYELFSELGCEWEISKNLMKKLEAFTCSMYALNPSTISINELRYYLFCAERGEIESHQLPPCLNSLTKHAQCANYQAAIGSAASKLIHAHQLQLEKDGN